jgi:hypothetical protein
MLITSRLRFYVQFGVKKILPPFFNLFLNQFMKNPFWILENKNEKKDGYKKMPKHFSWDSNP